MDIRKLQRVIVDGLEDVKAQNIVVFNTEHLSPLFERVIVASGTSNRQTKSLASSVREAVKAAGEPPPRTEGEANGEWIIVDCGMAVVHVMQPAIREYYHLEELWGDKPVRMKIGTAKTQLVKAAPVAVKRGTAANDGGRARVGAPAKRSAISRRLTTGDDAAEVKRARTAKTSAPAKRAAPAKRSAPANRSAPAKRVATGAKRVVRTVGTKGGGVTTTRSARGDVSAKRPRAAKA